MNFNEFYTLTLNARIKSMFQLIKFTNPYISKLRSNSRKQETINTNLKISR